MNFLHDNWHWVLAALSSGALLLWPSLAKGGGSHQVSIPDAVQLVNREKGLILDVSDASSYAQGHIVGSRNLPLAEIEAGKGLPGNKALPLILVSQQPATARKAREQLAAKGYTRALVLAGGLPAWREAQLPVEKSA